MLCDSKVSHEYDMLKLMVVYHINIGALISISTGERVFIRMRVCLLPLIMSIAVYMHTYLCSGKYKYCKFKTRRDETGQEI